MKKKQQRLKTDKEPNFILCDMGLQSAFAQACQNFQMQIRQKEPGINWLIIDNDTGQIISPTHHQK